MHIMVAWERSGKECNMVPSAQQYHENMKMFGIRIYRTAPNPFLPLLHSNLNLIQNIQEIMNLCVTDANPEQ